MLAIYIKYFDKEIPKVEKIAQGDWIDLCAAEDVFLLPGESRLVPLGVGMILPKGYEVHIVPRSSTFKKYGVIQTNHCGIIDNSYAGDNDQWMMPVYAVRQSYIKKGSRICQFRIVEQQPDFFFIEADHLNEKDRGGFGSTDKPLEGQMTMDELLSANLIPPANEA